MELAKTNSLQYGENKLSDRVAHFLQDLSLSSENCEKRLKWKDKVI